MKLMEITFNLDGTTDVDLKEGFSGMNCVEKTKQLEVILGGNSVEQQEKPEYFEETSSIDIGIDLNNGF